MTAWTLAPALETFTAQAREINPSIRIDTIGDAQHSARTSEHNPDDDRIVCACDVFDSGLLDDHVLALELTKPEHKVDWPRIKYVINECSIWSPARATEGWRLYTGPNPHGTHCHLSVTQAGKRDRRRWSALDALAHPQPRREDLTMPTAEQLAAALRPVIQQETNRALAILLRGEDLKTKKKTGHPNLQGLADALAALDVPRKPRP